MSEERPKSYGEKLQDPRWQKMRLHVFERDGWACQHCHDTTKTLHVHHHYYLPDHDPWDYPLEALLTLCADCHHRETDLRPFAEEKMLHVLRIHGFSADTVLLFATDIGMYTRPWRSRDVDIEALSWILRHPEELVETLKRFLAYLEGQGRVTKHLQREIRARLSELTDQKEGGEA